MLEARVRFTKDACIKGWQRLIRLDVKHNQVTIEQPYGKENTPVHITISATKVKRLKVVKQKKAK